MFYGKVTKISYTRNGERVNVYVDNKFLLSLNKNVIVDCNIYNGRELTEEMVNSLLTRDCSEEIFRIAFNKSVRRLHSRLEIKRICSLASKQAVQKITKKYGLDFVLDESKVFDTTCSRLQKLGLLDDEKFAKELIGIRSKKRSSAEIKKELYSKGIDRDLIIKLLPKNDEQEVDLIQKLLLKKINFLKKRKISKADIKKKAIQSLLRKGFHYEDIIKAYPDSEKKEVY